MSEANNISALGVAIYPHLNRPDVRFNEAGEYKTNLEVSEADAKDMVATIEKAIEGSISEAEAQSNGKKIKVAPKPYHSKDGKVTFKFKMKATGVNRKTKEPFSQRPALFDSKKNPIEPSSCSIWGGSKLKVAYTLRPYYSPAIGAGVVLQLKAVQIIELVEGKNTQMSLFDEEDGYTNNSTQEQTNETTQVQTGADF